MFYNFQGLTVQKGTKLAIHWPTEGTFQAGMAYVALGRCQRLEDVFIIIPKYKLMSKRSLRALLRKHIKVDAGALVQKETMDAIELERRTIAKSEKENNLIISYLNVRKGLIVKDEDVKNDDILMNSDIFGIGETCLLENAQVLAQLCLRQNQRDTIDIQVA